MRSSRINRISNAATMNITGPGGTSASHLQRNATWSGPGTNYEDGAWHDPCFADHEAIPT